MQDELHITEAQAVFLEKFLHHRGSIASFAAQMDTPLVDMIDILSAPAVQKRIKAANKLTKLRRNMVVADIEITALETLQQIAANQHADIVERRRAASNILRAIHKPKPRRRKRAINPRYSRGRRPQDDPFDDPPDGPGTPSPSQNRARQEAAVGHQTHSNHTSNRVAKDQTSPSPSAPTPPDRTAQNAAIYCPEEYVEELREARKNAPYPRETSSQDGATDLVDAETLCRREETTKLLEETTQALIELDELCAQEDPSVDQTAELLSKQSPKVELLSEQCSPVEPLSERCSPEPTESPEDERSTEEPLTERCHQDSNPLSPSSLCTSVPSVVKSLPQLKTQNGSNQHPQPNNDSPIPGKDNPWESHPFANAARHLLSNHDPP